MEDADQKRTQLEQQATANLSKVFTTVKNRLLATGSNASVEAWQAALTEAIQSMGSGSAREALERALLESADLGVSIGFQTLESNLAMGFDYTLAHRQARDWALKHTDDLLLQLNTTTTRIVGPAIARWIDNGEPLSALNRDLEPAFGAARAEAIAMTETTRAYAEGHVAAYLGSGVVQEIQWFTAVDERVCPYCFRLHEQVVEIKAGAFWDVLPEELRSKVKYFQRPPAHVRCRCNLLPVIKDVEKLLPPDKKKPKKPKETTTPKEPKKPKTPKVQAPAPTVEAPLPMEFTDPTTSIVWNKQPLYEGLELNGVKLQVAQPGFWEDAKPVELNEPALPTATRISAGAVIVEPDGRVWIVEPTDHFGGYEHTFPKGGMEAQHTIQQTALKEVFEESGLQIELTGYIGDFAGSTSTTRYYVAKRVGGAPWASDWESQAVKLVPVQEAERLLNVARDKNILLTYRNMKQVAEEPMVEPSPTTTPAPTAEPTGFPADPDKLVLKKRLGGSTGAELVEDPATGALYVRKRGANEGHLREEVYADLAYRALGVNVPELQLYETANGPVKLSRYLEGAQTLAEIERNNPRLYRKALDNLGENFAVDALLGNWDVIGLSADNILVQEDGTAWRIDNGGSLRYRAQGAKKSEFSPYVNELWTLRDGGMNPSAAGVFGSLNYADAMKQVRSIADKEQDLLAAVPSELRGILSERLASLKDSAGIFERMDDDKWYASYIDTFTKHSVGMRMRGIFEEQEVEVEGVRIRDKNGKLWDNFRTPMATMPQDGSKSIVYKRDEYLRANRLDPQAITDWADEQASSSWSSFAKAGKYYWASQRSVDLKENYYWQTSTAIYESEELLNRAKRRYPGIEDTFAIQHAFTYEVLRNTRFKGADAEAQTVRLIRTESEDVLRIHNMQLGDTAVMKRGVAESFSAFEKVEVYGSEVTSQELPFHRVLGVYWVEQEAGGRRGLFAGDNENEFVAMAEGIPATYYERGE